jgi:thiamine biosynthesis lipoprotein
MLRAAIVLTFALTLSAAPRPAAPAGDASTASAARTIPFRTRTMGTWGTVNIATTDSVAVADPALASLLVFHHVDSLMSNWTETSEVARINREAGKGTITIDREVADVIARSLDVSQATHGAEDITVEPLVRLWGFLGGTPHVPKREEVTSVLPRIGYQKIRLDAKTPAIALSRDDVRIDLGGIAKGYAVDGAAAVLRKAGVTNALVDLTGNMMAMGSAPGHDGWVVGVRNPASKDAHLLRVRLRDEAISTSGNYEQFIDEDGKRYSHIMDPRTGWPAQGVSSVTVVAKSALTCDAWDTGLFVLGSEKARQLAKSRDDIAIIVIEPAAGGRFLIWIEESLRKNVEIDASTPASADVRYF